MPEEQKRPITPTRIIPSTASTPPPAPPLPPAPAGTDPASLPPWRRPAPTPAPPAAPPPPENWHSLPEQQPKPGPIEVHVTFVPVAAETDDEPGMWARAWALLTTYIKPWALPIALAGALLPIPWTGYSIATTWAAVVYEARGMHQMLGYVVGFGTFALAGRRLVRTRSLLALFATVVTFVGLAGAVDWYDPITWLTGVTR